MSVGEKEILIKAVVQAVPTYSMSCFRLPKGLCEHLTSLMRNFWWDCKDGKRKTCWVPWDQMIEPKSIGGLGFQDMELFNLALLAQQAWRISQEPNSLSARVLKVVYYLGRQDFLEDDLGSSPSCIWRSIVDGREVLKEGLIEHIGTGEKTAIWTTNWLPSENLRRPIRLAKPNQPQFVSELINHAEAAWKSDMLEEFFTPLDAMTIANIPLCTRRQEDFWAWHFDKQGSFLVCSAYYMLVRRREQHDATARNNAGRSDHRVDMREWMSLWKVKVPSKIRIFL
jgi:hypothetical protein